MSIKVRVLDSAPVLVPVDFFVKDLCLSSAETSMMILSTTSKFRQFNFSKVLKVELHACIRRTRVYVRVCGRRNPVIRGKNNRATKGEAISEASSV